jgi:hypothetical protein
MDGAAGLANTSAGMVAACRLASRPTVATRPT